MQTLNFVRRFQRVYPFDPVSNREGSMSEVRQHPLKVRKLIFDVVVIHPGTLVRSARRLMTVTIWQGCISNRRAAHGSPGDQFIADGPERIPDFRVWDEKTSRRSYERDVRNWSLDADTAIRARPEKRRSIVTANR